MQIEHIGIAVADIAAELERYEVLFGVRPYKTEDVPSEGVRTHFLDAGGTKIELLESTRSDSPIATYLERHGPGLHHIAFAVDDVDAMHAHAAATGLRVLNPEPKNGADGKRIFFLHPKDTGGVLMEFCADR